MEAILDARFQRIETALQTLIDSITTYNPSPAAATDLVLADDELSRSLDTLAVHQRNCARIRSLQTTAAALDTQLKTSLSLLAKARTELLATPLSVVGDKDVNRANVTYERRTEVDFGTLISYARRISRYTVPPTLRQSLPLSPIETKDGEDAKMSNGDATTTVPPPVEDNTAGAVGEIPQLTVEGREPVITSPIQPEKAAKDQPPKAQPPSLLPEMSGVGWTALSPAEKAQLAQVSLQEFVPFPRDEDVRSGALARIHAMMEQGIDPALVGKPPAEADEQAGEEAGEDGARARGEAQERRRHEEAMARKRAEAERTAQRGQAGDGDGAADKKEPAFAGLELYDPDDD